MSVVRTLLIAACFLPVTACHAQMVDVWLGTSGAKISRGIYHCLLNSSNGRLTEPTLVAEIRGPGFLAMHPKQPVLYAVGTLDGKPSVVAYRITATGQDAALELLNAQEIGDGGAAHVAVDNSGTTLLTAQYGGGSTASFLLNEDGSIKEKVQLIDHKGGSGIVASRQDNPHAHWCGFSPDQKFAFVPDLGLDQVVIYKVDPTTAEISSHGVGQLSPGAGPRHMKFHPNGKWIYVLHELDLKVTLFDYNAQQGTMSPRQTIETVSREKLARELFKSCSEIRIHPSGRFLYAANRGHDTITVFSVDEDSGELSLVEVENARAVTPRNFNVSPDGKWLLTGGQDSHTLASFAIDSETGELTYNRSIVHAPACICVLFQHE